MSTTGSHGIAPSLNRNIKYDADKDFTHIALVASLPHVLLVNNMFPAQNLADWLRWPSSSRAKIDFASGGAGSINHVIGELLKSQAGISLTHIPYKGSVAAITDLRGNMVPTAVDALPANIANIRSGELRAFAITSAQRSPMAPEIPTLPNWAIRP